MIRKRKAKKAGTERERGIKQTENTEKTEKEHAKHLPKEKGPMIRLQEMTPLT